MTANGDNSVVETKKDNDDIVERAVDDGIRIMLPDLTTKSLIELTREMVSFMPRQDMTYRTRMYSNCFKGTDGVKAIQSYFKCRTKDDAIKLGKLLQGHDILDHVCGDHPFLDEPFFYRLQPYHKPHVLNSYVTWQLPSKGMTMGLLSWMLNMMDNIVSKSVNDKGCMDVDVAQTDPHFADFDAATCELQRVDLNSLDENTLLAFGINLYHLMLDHALIKFGPYPGGNSSQHASDRDAFFDRLCYNVGGDELSFKDLRTLLAGLDPRVHFLLHSGAVSCPTPKRFTSVSNMEEELSMAGKDFFDDDENLTLDEDKFEIRVSELVLWHRHSLAVDTDSEEIPDVVIKYMRNGHKKECLERMIALMIYSGRSIQVRVNKFNWNLSAVTTKNKKKIFKAAMLEPNGRRGLLKKVLK